MQADTPWCGHYTVWPAVWALAHTTQFAGPGWVYMDGACGQFDANTWRGSHRGPARSKTGDWSLVVVTGEKQTLRLALAPGLKTGPVRVWKSTASAQFIQQAPLELRDHSVELELEPEAIYTLTSTTGQQKGSHGPPPERRPFPFPFAEDFESYRPGTRRAFSPTKRGPSRCIAGPRAGCAWRRLCRSRGSCGTATGC